MGKKRQSPKFRSKLKKLRYTIDTIIEFGANPKATSEQTLLFGLMIAHDGNLHSSAFKAHPWMEVRFNEVLDRLAGYEHLPGAIFVDLMIDAISDLRPVYAGLVGGYFFCLMRDTGSPELAEFFKSRVLDRSASLFDNRAS